MFAICLLRYTLRGVSALLAFTRELIGDDHATHDACTEMAIRVLRDLVEPEGR
jgi:hypothetical protein